MTEVRKRPCNDPILNYLCQNIQHKKLNRDSECIPCRLPRSPDSIVIPNSKIPNPEPAKKNVMSAGKTRQKSAKKRSIHAVCEHFSPTSNAVLSSAIVFPVKQKPSPSAGYTPPGFLQDPRWRPVRERSRFQRCPPPSDSSTSHSPCRSGGPGERTPFPK